MNPDQFMSWFRGVGIVELIVPETRKEGHACRFAIHPTSVVEFDLVAAGRSVVSIAADLGVRDQTVYPWRNQRLDR